MKKSLILALAATVACAACSKVETVNTDQPQEIALSAMTSVATKAAWTATTFPDVTMKVSADQVVNGKRISTFSDVQFAQDGTTGEWKAGQYWPIGGTLDFIAYAESAGVSGVFTPTTGSAATSLAITLASNETNQTDVLFAVSNDNKPTAKVPMVFKHAEAWINFTIKTAAEVTGATIDKIELVEASNGGTLTVLNKNKLEATWTLDAATALTTVPDFASAQTLSTTAIPATPAGILVPAQSARNFKLTYSINGVQYEYEYNMPRGAWEMGKKYIYNITLNLNEIIIVPTVEEWVPVAGVDVEI